MVFIVAYKSSGEGNQVWLTLITSAARLTASDPPVGYCAANLENEQNNH